MAILCLSFFAGLQDEFLGDGFNLTPVFGLIIGFDELGQLDHVTACRLLQHLHHQAMRCYWVGVAEIGKELFGYGGFHDESYAAF
jgi:hypothetical protein